MRKTFEFTSRDAVIFVGLILLWLVAYKSADVFNFFETYSSLWFLPAGVTLSITMVAPVRFVLAPLVANLLLAVPIICNILGIEHTGYRDPILHSFRLFLVYGGAGLLLRFGFGIHSSNELQDQIRVLMVTILAAIIGALSGVSLHAAVGNFPWSVAWDILTPWAVGDAIGAFIVPPLLVPLLKRLFEPNNKQSVFPDLSVTAFQVLVILLAMFIAFWGAQQAASLGPLWYVILIPPVFFAVRGGFPSAATATALTTLLTPPTAYLLGFEGDRVPLQFLLLVSAGISLMIGAAITDRQLAFDAVKRSEENLEQQVHDRTAELREAYEFQQHLMRSIGHDLRQPVQSIHMMMQGLVREHKGTASAERLEQARDISVTAGDFISRVLNYAKRDAGKVELLAERFAIQRVFDQVQQTFRPQADAGGIQLDIQDTHLELNSDAHLLWEALSNLVQNAIRLSSKGEVVMVQAMEADDALVITVADQVTTSTNVNGQAGFGLDIVKQIAQLLDAQFELQPNRAELRFAKQVHPEA
ncbi:MASE1 domain-containing protein [uncultured Roseobacter sp.]|uniref:sensor histidine kinase n=1 Tax=uncultured Roseobacter sp. TaxID=114847 RepID=UPI0026351085|nr:MASE1 domain-containing protein [uncultured Roseobacter sp.]